MKLDFPWSRYNISEKNNNFSKNWNRNKWKNRNYRK